MADANRSSSPARGDYYLYMAAAFVIVIAGMRAAEAMINPLLLAIFLSVMSAPAYAALLKRGMAVWLALLTVVGVLSVLMLAVLAVVMSSIASFTSNQEYYFDLLEEKEKKLTASVSAFLPDLFEPEVLPADDAPVAAPAEPEDADAEDTNVDAEIAEGDTAKSESEPVPQPSSNAAKDEATGEEEEVTTEAPTDSTEPGADSEPEATDDALSTEMPPLLPTDIFETDFDAAEIPPGPPNDGQRSFLSMLFDLFDPATAISLAARLAGSIGQLLGNAFLIILTVIFILLEAGTFQRKLSEIVDRTEESTQRARDVIDSIHHYIVIKTWVSLATGLFVGLWVWWIGVSHAPLWALLAFLFNFIPNVGSVIASIPAILIAWLELGFMPTLAVSFGYILVNGTLGNFVEPRMMGQSLGLSPLIVFCSMVFWGWVLGPVGMLLSVPLTMTARIAMDGFDDTRWLATLMGNVET